MAAYLLRGVFLYFSTMTYVHLARAYVTNPGYLPEWLKTPCTNEGLAPVQLLRIYNMRTWMANGIYTFEEFADQGALADLEISFADSSTDLSITESSSAASHRSSSTDIEL